MQQNPHHSRNVARWITRAVQRYLMANYRRIAEEAANEIGACLKSSMLGADLRGAYARIRMCDQPLPDVYGDGQGGIPEPLSEGGATHPWTASGNTRGTSQGEWRGPIGGKGGGSSTPPTPTLSGQKHPPPCGTLQTVAERGVPQGTVKYPPWRERWLCLVDIVQHMWSTG